MHPPAMEKAIRSLGLHTVLEEVTRSAINAKAPIPVVENLEAITFLAQMGVIQLTPNVHGGRKSNG